MRHESGKPTLEGLRRKAAGCTDCPLFANATQTVFGEGPARARLMLAAARRRDHVDVVFQVSL